MGAQLISFDVFETLLVRAVSPPAAVFEEVGNLAVQRGLSTFPASTFGYAREWAETRANASGGEDVKLSDIYGELAFSLGLDAHQEEQLALLELEVEKRLLRPVPSVRPLVERARMRTGRLVFISDMYLPEEFILERLREHGFWRSGDSLYVSHSHGCSKATGKLFEIVAAAEGVDKRHILHHGNNRAADVRGPRKIRAKSVHLGIGNPNRFEAALERYRPGTGNIAAALSGASRLARLSSPAGTAHERALADVAAGVIGPLWTCYLMWVFQRAQALGLKRLYFVARDAEVLMRMAVGLAHKLGYDLELRYLYASRSVWNRAAIADSNSQVWDSLIWRSSDGVSNWDLLLRTGIKEAEARALFAPEAQPAAWASSQDRDVLKRALADLVTKDCLSNAVAESRALLNAYLDQEGLFDGVPHGFVDIGWKGTQHDVLAGLQAERNVVPARGLFFGLEDSTCQHGELREAYYFDTRARHDRPGRAMEWRRGVPATPSEFSMLEMFCAGSHGTLTGYTVEQGKITPVLAEGRDEEVNAWGLPVVREALASFVHHLMLEPGSKYSSVDMRQAIFEVVEMFRTTPTREEAMAWGIFPWELGQGNRLRSADFAPQRSFKSMLATAMAGFGWTSMRHDFGQWPEGSTKRSSALVNWLSPRESSRRLRRVLGKLLRKIRDR